MEEKITSLNIQPQAGVLGVFSRLNYKPWYAIAEFVDNSTQSFYNNEKTLVANGIKTVTVRVEYDFENNVLKITDDAFGMEMDDFARAVKVDSPPESKDGRNEFGMGLKTAASWFGNTWSVESTQFGSSNKYYTEVNIQELREKHLNTIDIISVESDPAEHGTTIIIRDVTKKIDIVVHTINYKFIFFKAFVKKLKELYSDNDIFEILVQKEKIKRNYFSFFYFVV